MFSLRKPAAQNACMKCGAYYSLLPSKLGFICYTCNESKTKVGKYKSKKTEYNGVSYDSKKEANRAAELDRLIKAGAVKYYLRQVPFYLPGGVKYIVDFQVFWLDDHVSYEDTKGFMTAICRTKIKMVEALYPVKIEVI